MGRERSGTRQHFLSCAASLIIVVLGACAPLENRQEEPERSAPLQHLQHLVSQGDFEAALQEGRKVYSASPTSPPGDLALFNLGLIYLNHANPNQEFKEALRCFTQLEKEFPHSSVREEAKTWINLLKNMETKAEQERRAHLQRVQHLASQGDFEGVLRENQEVLDRFPESPPGDAALFGMGLLHLHYANPKKDYQQALKFFKHLAEVFPESPLKEEAKIWVGVLEIIEQAKQVDIAIEEKKKELAR